MEAVVEIPVPTARDSETVVTALETAAVFRAKGDAAEALRWLQRAAESAGDDGDDERTLALARTAADLSHALSSAPPPYVSSDQHTPTHSRRLPKPPARSGAARAPEAHDDGEPTQPQTQSSPTPSPPSVGSLHHRPPPPSSRSVAYSTPSSSRPLPPPPSRSSPPASARAWSPPPLSAVPTRIEMRAADLPAVSDTEAAEVESDAEAQRLTQPVPVPSPAHVADAPAAPRLRQAARVSVVPSPDEAGLFLVRLLDDGSTPPANAAEALMVLTDPNSTVFSH